jgi:hemerythrin-like domain-containing protein
MAFATRWTDPVLDRQGGPVARVIEILMEEHRLIEEVLGSLETYAAELEGGRVAERPRVAEYVDFLRGFADAAHHGKEEDILFQRMAERGFSTEMGPLAVMLHEHQVGRAHVAGMRQVAEGQAAVVGAAEQALLISHAQGFIPLLRTHILKEDRILYPMAVRALTPVELEAMETAFADFDRAARAGGVMDRLRATAERLVAAFPPDRARMELASQGMGCFAHQ